MRIYNQDRTESVSFGFAHGNNDVISVEHWNEFGECDAMSCIDLTPEMKKKLIEELSK